MKDYFLKVYELSGFEKDPQYFEDCIDKNGKEIADMLTKVGAYDSLKMFQPGGSTYKPKKRLLDDICELFSKIRTDNNAADKLCSNSSIIVHERENLYLYMWMLENGMIKESGNLIYEKLLKLLGYVYEPATYDTMENVILYLVLKTNSKCDTFCRLIKEWNDIKADYTPKLDIQFMDNEAELTYDKLLNEVLKNGFIENELKTRKSLSSITNEINNIVKECDISGKKLIGIIERDTIRYIMDTYTRRQWYFLRIIQKTIGKQIDDFVDLYTDGYNTRNKGQMIDAMSIMFLDFGKNNEIKERIKNKEYDEDGIDLEKDLKGMIISVAKIYNAFNTVFDVLATDIMADEPDMKKDNIPDDYVDLYYESKLAGRTGLVPYIFAPKKNRIKRHIINHDFVIDNPDVDSALEEYYDEIYEEYDSYGWAVRYWTPMDDDHDEEYYEKLRELNINQRQVMIITNFFEDNKKILSVREMVEKMSNDMWISQDIIEKIYVWNRAYRKRKNGADQDNVNVYNAKENGSNRKKMILHFFMNESFVSRELLWLVLILSKVYGYNWTKSEIQSSVMFNSRCSMHNNENSEFDEFCESVITYLKDVNCLNVDLIKKQKKYVSEKAWKMEAKYLCLDGSAQSIKDIENGVAVFNKILKGEKVS